MTRPHFRTSRTSTGCPFHRLLRQEACCWGFDLPLRPAAFCFARRAFAASVRNLFSPTHAGPKVGLDGPACCCLSRLFPSIPGHRRLVCSFCDCRKRLPLDTGALSQAADQCQMVRFRLLIGIGALTRADGLLLAGRGLAGCLLVTTAADIRRPGSGIRSPLL